MAGRARARTPRWGGAGASVTLLFLAMSLFPLTSAQAQDQRRASRDLTASLDTPPDPYQEGLAHVEAGDWERALEVWTDARDDLSIRDIYDPRIGLAFVELVVEEEAEKHYALASEMLLWGFSGTKLAGYEDEVGDEVARIMPLMEDEEAEAWAELVESGSGEILLEVKRFWIEKDPTPGTDLNERLLEHWRRIDFARNKYRFATNSPYGTDDRGTIYVKFGPATREKSGMLGASEIELQIRVRDQGMRDAMRRYDVAPQYDVWVYDTLNPVDFTYFLFGNEGGTGPFRLVDGVHELIPTQAKSRSSARYNPGGIPMEYYLELFYYQDLSAVGGRFGRRFAELDALWNTYTMRRRSAAGLAGGAAPSEAIVESYSIRFQQEDTYFPETPPVEPVLSDYEGGARAELIVQPVRILRDGEPRLVIMALSSPRLRLADRSRVRRNRIDIPGYWMRHTLIVRDETLTEVGRLHERVRSARGDVSTFTLRHVDRPMHLTVTAETLRDGEVEPAPGPPFPGQAHFVPEAPLSTDPEVLEISDLATGVAVPEEVDASALPFPLIPTRRIWRRDPLKIYLELYHLALDAQDVGRFRANFRVLPLRDDGNVDRSREPVTLTVDLESQGATYQESFVIALRDQETGRYRLEVEVTDLQRGITRTRTAPLEIIR